MPVVFSESKILWLRPSLFIFLASGALRESVKIMDVHVLMEAGASGQTTLHVHLPVGVGYSTEQERALIQCKSVNSFRLLNVQLVGYGL